MNASQTTPRLREEADDEPEQPPSPSASIRVDVVDETGELGDEPLERLRIALCATASIAVGDDAAHEIRVQIVDDVRMGALHERHSGITGTTDVLTFDLRESTTGPLDVDLVLCLDEARRASATRSHDVVDELTLYALHGVLHCLGYDDHNEEGYRAMHEREDEILRDAGLCARFFGADR